MSEQICTECELPKSADQFREGIHASVCFGCRVGSAQFFSMAPRAADVRKRDREFAKDAAAYRRLRAEGLQPKGVNHSAMAETLATHKTEIDMGRSLRKDEKAAFTRDLGTL